MQTERNLALLGRDGDAMNGGGVLQHRADETEVDADRDRSCALLGALLGELDEGIARDVADTGRPERRRRLQANWARYCSRVRTEVRLARIAAFLVAYPGLSLCLETESTRDAMAVRADLCPPLAGGKLVE